MTRISMMAASLALAACVAGQDASSTITSAIAGTGSRCPSWGCDTNAATIGDGILFDELDLAGGYNAGGVRIAGANLADPAGTGFGTPVTLAVQWDRLVAFDVADPSHLHQGHELEGMIITLYHSPSPGDPAVPEERIELRIDVVFTTQSTGALTFWEGALDKLESYDISARRESKPPPKPGAFDIRICRGDLLEAGDWPDVSTHSALVYQGDHLDSWNRIVTPQAATLFNLACAGTAMAKLHLLRHTEASNSNYGGLYPTDFDQRTAMLKMVNADYCGDGRSFTVDGHPLRWHDNTGFIQRPLDLDTVTGGDITSIEAIWGRDGALCLDRPRIFKRWEIVQRCSIPMCTTWDIWAWAAGSAGHVISGNPRPPP